MIFLSFYLMLNNFLYLCALKNEDKYRRQTVIQALYFNLYLFIN